MKKYILAHDIGTTGNKGAIFDEKCDMIASVYHPYPTYYLKPTWVEQDPEDWWRAVCESTREVLSKAGIEPAEVMAVSFSGQMMSTLPVDRTGRCLRHKAIIWADSRAAEEGAQILRTVGFERYYNITGAGQVIATYAIAKTLWQKNHERELFEKTYKFLFAKDYVVCRLTGEFVTDVTDASNCGLLDIRSRKWSEELLEAIGVSAEKLPRICESTDVVGKISAEAAKDIGLLSGTPVVVGTGDMIAAATGAGMLAKGSCYIYIGSAAWVGVCSENPLFDLETRLLSLCHVLPSTYACHHTMYSAGICYQWTRDVICEVEKQAAKQAGVDDYDLLDLKASTVPAGSGGLLYLPYMRGGGAPYHDPNARGVFVGLNLAHKRENIVRAVLEGVAFNLRIFLENIIAKGVEVEEIRFIGGGAKGHLWRQIIADINGKEVMATNLSQEANSLGAAMVGAVGIGMFDSFEEMKEVVKIKGSSIPDLKAHERYNQIYPLFKETYHKLKDIFSGLSVFQL